MFDWREINDRFLSFFPGESQYAIAEYYGISQPTVNEWATGKAQVPWEKLKEFVDSRQISWNWLLEGLEPRDRNPKLEIDEMEFGLFDTPGINQRFLSLFPNKTQKELAEYCKVSQPAVSGWRTYDRQVPWDKLKQVVDSQYISWEWLLESIPPVKISY